MTYFPRILGATVLALATSAGACQRPAARGSDTPLETIRLLAGGPLSDEFLAQYQNLLPGVRISLGGARGSLLVVSALQAGTTDIGFAQADVVYAAYRTGLPDNSAPHTKLRGIAVGQSVNTYVVVRGDSPFHQIAELKGRRIALTPPGTRGELYARMILGAYGLDDKVAMFMPYSYDDMAEHLRDQTVDAVMFGGAGIPEQMINVNRDIGIRILGLSGDVITKLRGGYPFFNRVIVTSEELAGQGGEVQTLGVDNLLVCRQDLSDERVYQLTRGFIEVSEGIDRERAAATPIPLHSGAARYYREREVLQ